MDFFEQTLMEKYPEFFLKTDEGVVASSSCGVYCPIGWHTLVDDLLQSIKNQITNVYRSKLVVTNKKYYFWNGLSHIVNGSITILSKVVNNRTINSKLFKLDHKFRQRATKFRTYERVIMEPIIIEQIKEKFGTLRFYYSNGTPEIDGIVAFAEYLSSVTCEETGKRGELCHNQRGWYKTLCKETAERMGYIPTNEQNSGNS